METTVPAYTPPDKPGTLLTRALFLLMAGLLAGVVANALRPDGGLAWVYAWDQYVEARARDEGIGLITAEQLRIRLEAGEVTVLDARSLEEYDAGHVPGALSLPMRSVEEAFLEMQFFLLPDQPVVTYCSGPACDDALRLSLFLRDQGFSDVTLFPGGMEEWERLRHAEEGAQ